MLHIREGAKYAPPPPGVTPNYAHPDSNGDMYMIGSLVTLGIAFACLTIRIGTKLYMSHRRLQWDDILAVLALAFSIARTTCFAVDIYHYGIAHHVWDLPLPFPRQTWLLHRIADIMWPPGMLCAKLSVLLIYLDIFGHFRKFRYSCWALMFVNTAYLGATTLVHIFWCHPVGAAYGIKKAGQKAECIDGYVTDLVIGALNLTTDLAVLLLPMPMLYKLQLPTSKKLAVAAVFSVGLMTVGATIAREIEIAQKLKSSASDQTWVVMYEAVWISVELNTAIIASCLILCQQFFRYILVESTFGQSLQSLLRTTRSQPSQDSGTELKLDDEGNVKRFSGLEGSQTSFVLHPYPATSASIAAVPAVNDVPGGFIQKTNSFHTH